MDKWFNEWLCIADRWPVRTATSNQVNACGVKSQPDKVLESTLYMGISNKKYMSQEG